MSERVFCFRFVSDGRAAVVDTLQWITRGWVMRDNGGNRTWRVWVPSQCWTDYSGSEPVCRFMRPVRGGFRTRKDAAEWLIAHESECLDVVAELEAK